MSIVRNVHTTVQYPYCASILPSDSGGGGGGAPPVRSGEVNFFNCMSIFYEYVAKVMKQSFDPEVLFKVVEEVVRQLPQDITTYMVSIMYPTPSGAQMLSSDDVDAFWGNTNVRDVVLPAFLLKKMRVCEIAKRRAIYVLVVRLSEGGLLDNSNEPSVQALNRCKSACPVLTMTNRIKLTDKFRTNA